MRSCLSPVLLAAATILGAWAPGAGAATVTQVSPKFYIIELPANVSGWQSTGLEVCADSKWGLQVQGLSTCCATGGDPVIAAFGFKGPGGQLSTIPFDTPGMLVEGVPSFSLVGQIGTTSFYFGDGGIFAGSEGTASENPIDDGILSLGFNDNFYGDNGGSFIIYLTYLSGGCPPAAVDEVPSNEISTRLGPAAPNPMQVGTRFQFENVSRGVYSISVLDVTGRLVRSIYGGVLEPGAHTVQWDGTDGNGRTVPAGTYFCVAAGEGSEVARKVVVVP